MRYDSIFGRAIKTDIRSFNLLRNFIEGNKNLTMDSLKLIGSNFWYEIIVLIDSNKQKFFLRDKYYIPFFHPLRSFLRKNDCDPVVIDSLESPL